VVEHLKALGYSTGIDQQALSMAAKFARGLKEAA
jgi:hypothetical protein